MKRRVLLASTAAAALSSAGAARAQQKAMPVIGYLELGSARETAHLYAAFLEGLSEVGYVEGRNVLLESRWAEGRYERLSPLAADLVRRKVAVIATTGGSPSVMAAKAASTTIPIVFHVGVDPVAIGLVASLNRPSGNLTGVTSLANELGTKRLGVLHEAIPPAASIALLVNPNNSNMQALANDVEAAARTLGRKLQVCHAGSDIELDTVFETLVRQRVGGLLIAPDGFFNSRCEQLAALALRHAIPAIFQDEKFTTAGGLMSYGAKLKDVYRLVGTYSGRILKGEKPSELPVQQVTRVELVVNLKTAKALGLTIPPSIIARADELIE